MFTVREYLQVLSEAVNRKRTANAMAKNKEQKDNDLQKITQKNKDRATRTALKTGVNSSAPLIVRDKSIHYSPLGRD
jgi:hypothetical protein